ncbi:MAG: hypothetical protein EWV53_15840 [Microcystis panniformis Mp_MB_F_20051200_S9]|uniref:Uncharacterized protein n=1 Tax=Microcystis panniformis Mp_MB_F_20051200_S9 TaxID=2486223 RepID=A0A552PSF8_9CHRO|nr:MAG: hypothetical protein EWV87_17125 [Microcystis panniformis Mp_GB_SS_20050300_S99]TRV50183.1 MAG: hypothetical protein EWV43_06925 [Microcystis panniformis Mp_MB_F_20080800_S26D]TRV51781.1 MAG: hypothetical protein EWV42_09350 [Microcystis panniformis Mp_GB_SS_20050300_S99D]TRV57166.1 MAG: hypothetical protein EWV86_21505 [Microcystis panniformis Mp_MB_F_20051200_S9D]TRV59850.1 MAG: hypothetical protein EWV53_15840 [Microcystis panniformis Mp_MB_F_20051200_S9]TRV62298.1 MAG: hypothetical
MISLDYLEAINLCVLCVFVVRSSWSRVASALRSPAGMYPIIYFTHRTQESRSYFMFIRKAIIIKIRAN